MPHIPPATRSKRWKRHCSASWKPSINFHHTKFIKSKNIDGMRDVCTASIGTDNAHSTPAMLVSEMQPYICVSETMLEWPKEVGTIFFDEKHKWLTFHTRSWNLWGGVVIWEASMSFENVWEKQMFPSAPDMNATPAPQFFQWTHPFPLLLFCIGWKIQIIGVGQGVDAKIIK